MRDADDLLTSGLAVIERAYCMGAYTMRPLFSGGHDSLCASHVASQHRAWPGVVYHIDTGIGAKYTREFVERVCEKMQWSLQVLKSDQSYEQFVADYGFPGPGGHSIVYRRLKERCVDRLVRGRRAYRNAAMLVNGARSQESVRRMGHVSPINIIAGRGNRVWTAPCHDWTKAEQQHYMDEWGLPINKLKIALGMSGECFCGAFAAPGELDMIRKHAPDVAAEIDRLTEIAKQSGTPCVWGQRPQGRIKVAPTGPLCTACDVRLAAAGAEIGE